MVQRITPRYMHLSGSVVVALEQGTTNVPMNVEAVENKLTVVPYYWNPDTLGYEVARQVSTAGGGSTGGGGSTAVDATITNPTTAVDASATLTSAGSTRLVGRVTVDNPTTSIDVANQPTVDLSSVGSTRSVGTVNQGSPAGSSADAWWVRTVSTGSVGAGSTTVDANLTSAGSTRLVGTVSVTGSSANMIGAVAQGAGSTSIAPWYVISTASAGAGSTSVDATLTSGGSTRVVGTVTLASAASTNSVAAFTVANPTTGVTVSSGVILGPSTAFTGLISSGTQQIGSVALVTGTTGTMGAMAQGPGSSANNWVVDGFAFSSANTSRTSISTTVQNAIVAASTSRVAMIIASLSTVQTVGLGFSTAAVTTALANVSAYLPPLGVLVFGMQSGLPNFTGNIRGINLTSTTVAGGVVVTQFTNT